MKNKRFALKSSILGKETVSDVNLDILVDKVTGVQYIQLKYNSLTPLLDKDGKPLLDENYK